jgi:pimeloyl-ACP methyl ester carboxylesterase
LTTKTIQIAGIDLELFEAGQGAPLLWLHGAPGFSPKHEFVDLVAGRRRLIAPSHPGFGKSSLPDWLDSVDDIVHVYLELLDKLDLRQTDVVGTSLGGWIAAEVASKVPERIRKLVLVGPVGVKVGPPDKLDIPDIFAMPQDAVNKLIYHDPERMKVDMSKLSDEELAAMFRNRETLALLVWEPWMHNPKLKHRLHRAAMPALLVRGESDGLVSAEYLAAYAKLFPKSRVLTIPGAGHPPQQEQPQALVRAVLEFLDA